MSEWCGSGWRYMGWGGKACWVFKYIWCWGAGKRCGVGWCAIKGRFGPPGGPGPKAANCWLIALFHMIMHFLCRNTNHQVDMFVFWSCCDRRESWQYACHDEDGSDRQLKLWAIDPKWIQNQTTTNIMDRWRDEKETYSGSGHQIQDRSAKWWCLRRFYLMRKLLHSILCANISVWRFNLINKWENQSIPYCWFKCGRHIFWLIDL